MSEWRAMLADVSEPADRLAVFEHAAGALARRVADGKILKPDAVDELLDVARCYDFFGAGEAEIERLIGEQFELVAAELERGESAAEMAARWERDYPGEHQARGNGSGGSPGRLIRSSAEFVANFVPPEYVLDGVLQRRFVYSLTGTTGAGKTAIMLLLSALVALERTLGNRGVERGRVLYLAGENPDDARMRWIAMAEQMDFPLDSIDVHFIPGTFKISEMMERIRAEIAGIGDVALIVVDTSAAFYEGDDENNNRQQGLHARRLRELTTMPGGPCVLTACHPPKNAGDDNLQPRGGGAFLAEMDGNLTARKSDGLVELHWQGKFRGPDFAPVPFQLRTVTHERLKDSKGRLIPTVVAAHISDQAQAEIEQTARAHEDQLLAILAEPANRSVSQRDLAKLLGWFMRDGTPYHVRVQRGLAELKKAKLITIERDGIELTAAGRKCVGKPAKPTEPAAAA